jgi:hypothetical protein
LTPFGRREDGKCRDQMRAQDRLLRRDAARLLSVRARVVVEEPRRKLLPGGHLLFGCRKRRTRFGDLFLANLWTIAEKFAFPPLALFLALVFE